MKNARVTYFGPKETLHLEMQSFQRGKELITRLDNLLPAERRRHKDTFLVRGMDMSIINIGALVPEEKSREVIEENPMIDDNHTGFMVMPPNGYTVVDAGIQLKIVAVGAVAEEEPTPVNDGKDRRGRRRGAADRDSVRDSLMEAF